MNITKESALQYHEEGRPGKIEVVSTKTKEVVEKVKKKVNN